MEFVKTIEEIKTREDFSNFIKLLLVDYKTHGDSWENIKIEHFLDSISEWVLVMKTQYDTELSIEQENKWQTMAKVFYAGKIYE